MTITKRSAVRGLAVTYCVAAFAFSVYTHTLNEVVIDEAIALAVVLTLIGLGHVALWFFNRHQENRIRRAEQDLDAAWVEYERRQGQ